jgi:hypothetical protein
VGIASAGAGLSSPAGIGEQLDAEAGISAYFRDQAGITLNSVWGVFRTIEVSTSNYIIGSVAVPNYGETEDTHVYIHKDGWVLAYYLRGDPASKMIDMKTYRTSGNLNTTKLQNVLAVVAAAAGSSFSGSTYYDFRYPNATNIMVVAENNSDGDNSFTINIPSSYGYYERGWAVINNDQSWVAPVIKIDGVAINSGCAYCYGTISAPQLLPDITHDVSVVEGYNASRGALILTYRMP